MRTQSSATHPDAERVQVALLRQAGAARRFELTRSMIQTTRQLSWQGLRRAHPEASDDELAVLWVRVLYGTDLADRLQVYLTQRT